MKTRSRLNRFTVVAVLCALLAGAVYVTPARAAGIVVNSAADAANPGDGLCTLREAITAANTNTASGPGAGECAAGSAAGTDTITFAGNYTITLAPALGQLPPVTSPITVNGNGAASTVIRAHASPDTATFRVFYVASGGNLTLNRVSVRNGRCNGSCAVFMNDGSGILNLGTLRVMNSVIAANSASGSGAISNLEILSVGNSVISGNSAGLGGGGIYNLGNSSISGSTFSGNTSPGAGAAISNAETLNVTNSTFSGNSSAILGGGIYNGTSATTSVVSSTFSGNSAGSSGGGIYRASGAGSVFLQNTIVANSTAGGNCSAGITNGGFNLDSGATCGWGSNLGSLSNTNPRLGPLAGNGGPTQTMALLPGSPAIDAGTDVGCPPVDQRGKKRPQGTHCDIGAYESPTVVSFLSVGAQDGWVLETSETSNQGGPTNAANVVFLVGDTATRRQYRSILHFNTNALHDTATIVQVALRVKRQSVIGTNPFSTHMKIAIDVRKGVFTNAIALQPSDFQAAASQNGAGFFSNNPAPNGWYTAALQPAAYAYVNRVGMTQFRLRFQVDDDNDAVADFIQFFSGDAAAGNRPVLVISYYLP